MNTRSPVFHFYNVETSTSNNSKTQMDYTYIATDLHKVTVSDRVS